MNGLRVEVVHLVHISMFGCQAMADRVKVGRHIDGMSDSLDL